MSGRYSTNWDRKGWPGLKIQLYYGCPCIMRSTGSFPCCGLIQVVTNTRIDTELKGLYSYLWMTLQLQSALPDLQRYHLKLWLIKNKRVIHLYLFESLLFLTVVSLQKRFFSRSNWSELLELITYQAKKLTTFSTLLFKLRFTGHRCKLNMHIAL